MSRISKLSKIPTIGKLGSNVGSQSLTYAYFFNSANSQYIVRNADDSATLTATTSIAIACRLKPTADGTATAGSQNFFGVPYMYGYIRNSTNDLKLRYSDGTNAREVTYSLGAGFRGSVHFLAVLQNNGADYTIKLYTDGILRDSQTYVAGPVTAQSLIPRIGANNSSAGFYTGYIRRPVVYTFTGAFADSDAPIVMNGGDPVTTTETKYFEYGPPISETGTTATDQSGNARNGTLTNGPLRSFTNK